MVWTGIGMSHTPYVQTQSRTLSEGVCLNEPLVLTNMQIPVKLHQLQLLDFFRVAPLCRRFIILSICVILFSRLSEGRDGRGSLLIASGFNICLVVVFHGRNTMGETRRILNVPRSICLIYHPRIGAHFP